jgi:non-canonical purine NTP pyrophosphatase (RdgB/HAM1 family)
MNQITFITGNVKKAEYLEKYLGFKVVHLKLDLDEIQSLDLFEIVEHKVKQAFNITKSPVIVEDVALTFLEMGNLPGPFIKFFLQEMSEEKICELPKRDRRARASCVFGFYDGSVLELLEGHLDGKVAEFPRGENGYGWDRVFEPDGYGGRTRAELNEVEDKATYTEIKPFAKLKDFLENFKN